MAHNVVSVLKVVMSHGAPRVANKTNDLCLSKQRLMDNFSLKARQRDPAIGPSRQEGKLKITAAGAIISYPRMSGVFWVWLRGREGCSYKGRCWS